MKYKCIKNFPGSTIATGEIDSVRNLAESYPEFFQLVEYNYNGRIIKVGDKVGPMAITKIDPKNKCVFFENGEFVWMDKMPSYYSVIDWRIHSHAMPSLIKTQFTCDKQEDAEKFVFMNYPCISLAETLLMDRYRLELLVQKKLDERPS